MSERLRFLGHREDVAEILRSSDVLIAPSRYEPYGLNIAEALSSGIPAIASKSAGACEMITGDLEELLLVEPMSADERELKLKNWRTSSARYRLAAMVASKSFRENMWAAIRALGSARLSKLFTLECDLSINTNSRTRLLFVVESGTDVRLIDGLAEIFELKVLCRRIVGGFEINWPSSCPVSIKIGPASRLKFALWVLCALVAQRDEFNIVLVQGYALAAIVCNIFGRLFVRPITMLVCSPVELYYECRQQAGDQRYPYRNYEALGLRVLAWLNARIGQRYTVLSEHLATVVRSHGGGPDSIDASSPSTGSIPAYIVQLVGHPVILGCRSGCQRSERSSCLADALPPKRTPTPCCERSACSEGRDLRFGL